MSRPTSRPALRPVSFVPVSLALARRARRVLGLALITLPLLAISAGAQVFLGLSTVLGGTGTDQIRDLTTDATGNLYLVGTTTSTDLAGQSTAPVGSDVFVAKLDPTGQQLLYLSLFGGDQIDVPWAVEVDASGRAYVAGYTTSASFPAGTPFATSVDNTDAFLLEVDASGALTWAVVWGGPNEDGEFNGGIGIHPSTGHVYVGSRTNTTTLTPVNAFSDRCPNGPCAFITGFDPSLAPAVARIYQTYVTSPNPLANQEDGGLLDLDVDASGDLYAFGFANPASQVVLAGQGFQDASGDPNNNDHVLVKLDPSQSGASQRVYSTFIGGFGDETERGRIEALDSGVVYVGAKTDSTAATFPLLNALQGTNGGGEDGYVAKIDTNVAGASSQLFTTFLGGVRDDEINAIAVDAAGNAWVAVRVGLGGSALFPQMHPLPGSPMPGIDDDAAVAAISSDGSSLLFAGPSVAGGGDQLQGIAVQPSGRVVVGGSGGANAFPLRGGLPLNEVAGQVGAIVGLDPIGDQGLVLEASVTPDPARTGDTFAIQYVVQNRGVTDASNAILTTDFPIGLSATSTTGGCSFPTTSATCDFFEDIPRGGDAPVFLLASAAADGSYGLNASVTSDLVDPSPGNDSASTQATTDAIGSFPATLALADFDVVAPTFDTGAFALDTPAGVLATSNGSLGDTLNLMASGGGVPFQIERILGQGEVAFGFVDDASWTPSAGDGEDLFGRDFNASADRVFAIVDSRGRVELRTAGPFDAGRVVDTGFVPLGRPGLLSITVGPTSAEVLFDGHGVASGDPFTSDFRDADPANVGDDFVISVGYGTEDRGAAILSVPEPGFAAGLAVAALGLAALRRR